MSNGTPQAAIAVPGRLRGLVPGRSPATGTASDGQPGTQGAPGLSSKRKTSGDTSSRTAGWLA